MTRRASLPTSEVPPTPLDFKRCARIDDLSLRDPSDVDTVTFSFPSSTHTATLSTFANPCVANSVSAFNAKGPGDIVFDVTSTNASWFFCATPGHVGRPHLDLLAGDETDSALNRYDSAREGWYVWPLRTPTP